MLKINQQQLAMRKIGNTWFINHLGSQLLLQLSGSLATLWDLLLVAPVSGTQLQQQFLNSYPGVSAAQQDFPELIQVLSHYNLILTKQEAHPNIPTITSNSQTLLKAMRRKYLKAKKLLAVDYEITNHCNFHCLHCYNYTHKPSPTLNKTQITRLCAELAEAGVLFLTLTGGECTLAPHFSHTLAAARKHSMAITIFSNGSTVTPELIASYHKYNIAEVKISIYGANETEYATFTRRQNYYAKVQENLLQLKKQGINVTARLIVTTLQQHWHQTLHELTAAAIPCEIQTTLVPTITGATSHLQYQVAPPPPKSCQPGITKLRILADGTIVPCAMLRTPLGNIQHSSFASILQQASQISCKGCGSQGN